MNGSLSPKVIAGVISAAVVIAAVGLFLGLRDKTPTREVKRDAAATQAPPPPASAEMPAWAMEKLRAAEGSGK